METMTEAPPTHGVEVRRPEVTRHERSEIATLQPVIGGELEAAHARAVIAVETLDLFYSEKQALHGITMDLLPRRVTALIGPSGCGKSTLLRCLNRMNDLIDGVRIEGKVLFEGVDNLCTRGGRDGASETLRHGLPEVQPLPESIYENVVTVCGSRACATRRCSTRRASDRSRERRCGTK